MVETSTGNIVNVHNMQNCFCIYRRESNCPEEEEQEEGADNGEQHVDANTVGVEQVEDASNETITTPPDDQVAREIDAIVNPVRSSSTATASTSSSSSSGMASKVHLQAPKAKRYTPAAKQRQELTATMLEAFKSESQKLVDDKDELDLSFAGYAKRMRLFLTNDQREELNTEIGTLVSTAIRNVKAGMPLLQKAPVYRPTPTVLPTSNMQNQAVDSRTLVELPQPPQLQPLPQVQQGQLQQDNVPATAPSFYIAGPTSMNYEMTRNLDFNTM